MAYKLKGKYININDSRAQIFIGSQIFYANVVKEIVVDELQLSELLIAEHNGWFEVVSYSEIIENNDPENPPEPGTPPRNYQEIVDELDDKMHNFSDAEIDRAANEITRISSESTRVSNEIARVSSESVRASRESTRVSSEATRVSNEVTRVSGYATMTSKVDSMTANDTISGIQIKTQAQYDALPSTKTTDGIIYIIKG